MKRYVTVFQQWGLWLLEAKVSSGAPLTKRAPTFPIILLARLEELLMDEMYAKVWASLKRSDVQAILPGRSDVEAILPGELRLIEGRLTTIPRRTKTSGPNRPVTELPVCVSD